MRVVAIAVLAVGLAACGGGDDEALRLASDGVFACLVDELRLEFDPTNGVTVTTDSGALARATFTRREVSPACSLMPGAPRTTAAGSPYDDDSLAKGIYRRAEIDCAVGSGVRIDLHPIFNANIGENDGSVLLIADGLTIVASAVLKSKGDPRASRIYHAPRYCTAARLR